MSPRRLPRPLRLTAAVLATALSLWATWATAAITDVGLFLDQTENIRLSDHSRFVQKLAQIHREAPAMTSSQQWRLRYLDGWESSYEGDYAKAENRLQDVSDHSGDANLAAKALALLMSIQVINQHYDKAYELASNMVTRLPKITDPLARFLVLENLAQVYNFAGQPNLAAHYARMMRDTIPPGESECLPGVSLVVAEETAKRLSSSSPSLENAIATCNAAKQPVLVDLLQLVKGDMLLGEHLPNKVLPLLNSIRPTIESVGLYPHRLSWHVQQAQAYLALGEDAAAENAARAAIAMKTPGDVGEHLADAYHVLYEIEKKRGHGMAALENYEHYVKQNTSYLNDVSARALAYQRVQQNLLAQKMQNDALERQNQVLRLERSLTEQAAHTTRLYAVLLLGLLTLLVLWLLRVKRLQLRFREMARRDGLTGILNHQHFMQEAETLVAEQAKRSGNVALALIDLDHFKQINDVHGHVTGDLALRHIVSVVQAWLRPGDLFGRLGGEEFGLLLSGCAHDECVALAEHVREAVAATPLRLDGEPIVVTASIGMAFAEDVGFDLSRLFHHADATLYAAKRAGRNRVMTELTDEDLLGRSVRDPRPA
ncbi:GGDEF domain-containing protein [Dyella ginsengisoli]|uniref:GGDEF domain-containing protein n=1 Tax=Dyella ginsengisoli TaxID=363848 RepID=UPI000363D7FD|nr:GGDEF domain-containing protein [Dyella ginsengisoli]